MACYGSFDAVSHEKGGVIVVEQMKFVIQGASFD